MKRFLLSVFLAAAAFMPAAAQNFQDLFDEFSKEAAQEFSDFQDEANKAFVDLLRESWEEFRVFAGVERPVKPEPDVLPVAPADSLPASVQLPDPMPETVVPNVEDNQEDEPLSYPEEELADSPIVAHATESNFSFYNVPIGIYMPDSLYEYRMKGNKETDVADFWQYLASCNYDSVIQQSLSYASEIGFNDWAWYVWVDALAAAVFGESSCNEREVFKTFLLNQIGIDSKLGVADGVLVTITAVKEQVYSRLFCNINDKSYYFDPDITSVTEFFTYEMEFPIMLHPISLEMRNSLRLSDSYSDAIKSMKKHSTVLEADIVVPVDERLCSFYMDYPQMDVDLYARAAVSPFFSEAVLSTFRPYMNGLTEFEKVTVLMAFMHYDFEYATDQEQFGYEKPFFPEEDFIYPYNDCEDRSILFAFLVRNLVGLDVVLIDYPDHIATAVCFNEDISGDFFMYESKRYVICDPTYIGASVGMTMDGYTSTPFKVISL